LNINILLKSKLDVPWYVFSDILSLFFEIQFMLLTIWSKYTPFCKFHCSYLHSSYGSSYAPLTNYNFSSTFASWHLHSISKGGVSEAWLTSTQIQGISRYNNKSGVYEIENIWKGDNIFQQAITWKWRGFRKN